MNKKTKIEKNIEVELRAIKDNGKRRIKEIYRQT
jgi:hypothetical protein